MKSNTKKVFRLIEFHSIILFKGIVKMLYGAFAAKLLALGTYGFIKIASESGYDAVFDFLGSVCIVIVALVATYLMGGNGKKGAKK